MNDGTPTPAKYGAKKCSSRERYWLAMGIVMVCLVVFVVVRQSSNTIVLGSVLDDAGDFPIENLSHQTWDDLVSRYVNQRGLVDYAKWAKSDGDIQNLKSYLESISLVGWNSDGRPQTRLADSSNLEKALWINVHNALMVYSVLQVYPTASVQQHYNPFGFNVWNHVKVFVGPRAYSLEDLHTGPLNELADPRVRFAQVRASLGSPRLANSAYTAESIDQQLQTAMRRFLTSPANLRTEGQRKIHLNPMLRDVLERMPGDHAHRLKALLEQIPGPNRPTLIFPSGQDTQHETGPTIVWMKHDWSLNAQ